MNIENVNKAIAVMERVKDRGDKLNMSHFQRDSAAGVQHTEDQLHACGTPACFAGWLAVSPEWQEDGGAVGDYGQPVMAGLHEVYAIADWFDCGEAKVESIVYPEYDVYGAVMVDGWSSIEPRDVISALERLRDTGSAKQ